MKKTTRNRIWAASILAGFLGACALPMSSTPTQFVFPTPNLTMTALFHIPPTATAGVVPMTAPAPTTVLMTATPSATLSPTALNCTNLAQFVSETIGDLSYIAPGTAFIKTWTLKNTGTCTWGAGYALVFDTGDQMGGPASVPLTASVPPNALYTFTVNLTAPATAGQYQGFWKLQTSQGVKFGVDANSKAFWVYITTVPLAPACNAKTKRPDANGALIEAYAMTPAAPVVIDGLLNEWDPLVDSVNKVVFGSTDNTAVFSLKWDSEYLYLAVQVTDNSFNQNSGGGADLYKGDSVEFLVDTNLKGDYCDTAMNSDDYQFGISPGNTLTGLLGNPTSYLWYPLSKAGAKVITTAATPFTGGWIMESRIPWNVFGITPSGSEYYGFGFSVSDDDHADKVQQDGMISTALKRTYPSNPTLWGTLEVEVKTGP
jgi:hypothetical protein